MYAKVMLETCLTINNLDVTTDLLKGYACSLCHSTYKPARKCMCNLQKQKEAQEAQEAQEVRHEQGKRRAKLEAGFAEVSRYTLAYLL